jgi:hypothetical protein
MSAEDYKDDKGSKAKLQTEIEAGAKDFVDAAERILVKINLLLMLPRKSH